MTGFHGGEHPNGHCHPDNGYPGCDFGLANNLAYDGCQKLARGKHVKVKDVPFVREGKLHNPGGSVILALPGQVDRSGWVNWLENHKSFRYESVSGATVAVVKQKRTGRSGQTFWYWYANKHIFGVLKRRYLGRSENVTVAALEQATGELVQLEQGERDRRRKAKEGA